MNTIDDFIQFTVQNMGQIILLAVVWVLACKIGKTTINLVSGRRW